MTFRAISRQDGSIGAEMYSSNLIKILQQEAAKRKNRRTPLEVVDAVINVNNLAMSVMDKYTVYRNKIAEMDFAAAISYTINFYNKGLATYLPTGLL